MSEFTDTSKNSNVMDEIRAEIPNVTQHRNTPSSTQR